MAEEIQSEARLRVQVQGQDEVDRLAKSFAALGATGQTVSTTLKPAAVSAAGATQARQTTSQIQQHGQQAHQQVRTQSLKSFREIFRSIGSAIKEPFEASGKILRVGVRQFAAALDPLFSRLTRLGPTTLLFGGIGLALVGLLKPLIALWAGSKLLGTSFEWAKEKSEEEIKAAAETRRRYPGLVGEAFSRAQDQVQQRIQLMTAMFGDGALDMSHAIERRMIDVAAGRGSDRDREVMERWGLTLGGKNAFEAKNGPADIVTYLERFVKAREAMETQINANPQGEGAARLRRNVGRLIRDAFDFSGGSKEFADMTAGWHAKDIESLKQKMAEVATLGPTTKGVTQEAINFQISLKAMHGAFEAIKRGIIADVQPSITGFMDNLRKRLTEVGANGETLGRQLRELGKVMIEKSWQTLDAILRKIDLEAVNEWIRAITEDFHPEQATDSIITFGKTIVKLTGYLIKAVNAIEWIFDKAGWIGAVAGFANPAAGIAGAAGGAIGRAIGGAVAGDSGGGGGATGGGVAGGSTSGGPSTGVQQGIVQTDNITDREANLLGLIRKYEAPGGNVRNYRYDPGHTAQGYFQITNSTWRDFAPRVLGANAPPNAMAASYKDQQRVALAILRARGINPWVSPKFRRGAMTGEDAGPWRRIRTDSEGERVPTRAVGDVPTVPSPPTAPGSPTSKKNDFFTTQNANVGGRQFMSKEMFEATLQGRAFGAAAANTFRAEVGTVGIGTGNVAATSSGVAPRISPPPTGGDTPTE